MSCCLESAEKLNTINNNRKTKIIFSELFFLVSAAFDGCLWLFKSRTSTGVSDQLLYIPEVTVRAGALTNRIFCTRAHTASAPIKTTALGNCSIFKWFDNAFVKSSFYFIINSFIKRLSKFMWLKMYMIVGSIRILNKCVTENSVAWPIVIDYRLQRWNKNKFLASAVMWIHGILNAFASRSYIMNAWNS